MWAEANNFGNVLAPVLVLLGVVLIIMFSAMFVRLASTRGRGGAEDSRDD